MSLFSRIAKAITGSTESRTRILSDTQVDAFALARDDDERRRPRGRRGGRGRNRGGAETPDAPNANGQGSNGARPAVDARPAGPARPQPARSERPPTRWRRPNRDTLDAPLPEDVAFRPATEGGDASIVPSRRRPAPGAQRHGRVLFSGLGQYVSREQTDVPPAAAEPPLLEHVEHDHDSEGEATGEPKRRRRGRRGGRGRRRGGEGVEGGTPADHAGGPASALGSEASEASEGDFDDIDGDALAGDDGDEYADVRDSNGAHAGPDEDGSADGDADGDETREALPAVRLAIGQLGAWTALGIAPRSLESVARFGFVTPTPIQERTIPPLLAGRDIVGVAQTGTGKTLAFGLPLMERLDPSRRAVQALVLVPTRELAQQVLDVLQELGRSFGLDAVGLLGGHALERDFRALQHGPQLVVGTPGRIIDHLRRGTLSLESVRYAVLDEADQMLDIGFLPDITRILSRTPRARQTALFSATMPHSILRLVRRYMESPETVAIAPELSTVESVQQIYFEVAQRDKVRGLRELIERELKGRTLVFVRTRRGVDYLADLLEGRGVRVGALHGDMEQRRRDAVVQRFRDGALDILIATNVAARGLDIPEITHVVNFDVPQNPEEYIHRIGRTGRMGREGKAITFVCERDLGEFDVLLHAFGERLQKEQLELYA